MELGPTWGLLGELAHVILVSIPCQQLPGHLMRRVQEADLSSAQRRAVRALDLWVACWARSVSGDGYLLSGAVTIGSILATSLPGPGWLVETVVQRIQMTLGVLWRVTVSVLAAPGLEKLLEQKGPFPVGSSNKDILTYFFGNRASSVGFLFCLPATLKEKGRGPVQG